MSDLDRSVALLHHMTYPLAHSSFSKVAERDPDCAAAYWGMAMTLFQPLWPTRPSATDLERGWELVQEARLRLSGPGRDEMLVEAAAAFFDTAGDPDYWTRIGRWAEASAAVFEAYPKDLDAGALFALSHLAIGSNSGDAAAYNARAAEVLSRILTREPTHPGAIHYTIHANDFTGRERESLDVVRRYGEIAPLNPHALHMPTHIFVRLGDWDEVIAWNRRAADAALTQRVGPSGEYVWDEFPHAVEYLVYAHLQRGDDAAAHDLIRTLAETPDLQPSFKTAFHLASTAARYVLERQAWEAAARLPVRVPASLDWDRFPWPEAVVWFARGLGSAHLGETRAVDESLDRLTELSNRASSAGEPFFASQIDILALELRGWKELGRGNPEGAVELLREAASLEARTPKHPVTPAATIPATELLGDLYAALGEQESARAAYSESNDRIPGRLNTLLGLARSSLALGDRAAARAYYAELLERASGSSERPGVEEARAYMAGKSSRDPSPPPSELD